MTDAKFPQTLGLFIGGEWRSGNCRDTLPIENPATGETLADLPVATDQDIADAIASSVRGFSEWSALSPWARSDILMRAQAAIGQQAERIAEILTLEDGKPLGDSLGEVARSCETLAYFAEEGKRTFGKVYPPREPTVSQSLLKRPIGPVAAFAAWNFPLALLMRKIGPALAAGCSVIAKPAEECPAACIEMVRIMVEAGVPGNALNLIFGVPAQISERLISAPEIRKITFTGSTAVGKLLAEQAGRYMKEATMELGGHAPVIVFDDVDVIQVAKTCALFKFRNAGQVCLAPSRFYVHESLHEQFVNEFQVFAKALKVGPGMEPGSQMGPLINARRMNATETLVADAVSKGAQIKTGGERLGDKGYFYAPTVLTEVAAGSRILEEEPFCPVAPIMSFSTYDEAIKMANRDDVGLSAYAFTNDLGRSQRFIEDIGAGWIGVNDFVPLLADAPVAAHKDSGLGYEGGSEGLDMFLETKFVSQRVLRSV